MATNLTKYPGKTDIVEAIFNYNPVPLDMTLASQALADELFENNFMPYAIQIAHWGYDGAFCNCQDLADAFLATWVYVKTTKRPKGLPMDVGTKIEIMGETQHGLITKPWQVASGPARGNVRVQGGMLDGRCLFPNHTVCQVGTKFYDPTFNKVTNTARECVEREIARGGDRGAPAFWFSADGRYLYAHNTRLPALRFSDSWQQMDARVWVSSAEWKTKTARDRLHFRSLNLQKVDTALSAYEQQGDDVFQQLKTAFEHWGAQDPKEALNINVDHCVSKLKSFLGSPFPNNL